MSLRSTDYKFVSTDAAGIKSALITEYERITKHTLQPADPEMVFLSWVASVIVQERVNQNYIGNQNIPSRAEGENLDALGEWIYSLKRRPEQPARCTERFTISEAQQTAILIPKGTRVTDTSKHLIWFTVEDALVEIGSTTAEVEIQCETPGAIGNGYAAGQINTLIDVDNVLYYLSCANINETDGGAGRDSDDTYFEMMRAVLDSFSTAGPKGAYEYWAKSVSNEIADVKAIQPRFARDEKLTVYTLNDNNRVAFLGGEEMTIESLEVYAEGSDKPAALGPDYTVDYLNGLAKISLKQDGALKEATSLRIVVEQEEAGRVYIYALMNDGTIASETIKEQIYAACNDDTVRPLTDYVSMHDPLVVEYDIDFTYYISRTSQLSLNDIQIAINNAVKEYTAWQSAKLGRDINPSILHSLLMQTGAKRVDIRSPTFRVMSSGADRYAPQVAKLRNTTIVNGGYEDE